MPKYFKYFPQTIYSLQDNVTSLDTITNLTSKFSFAEDFKNNTSLYYQYSVTDGETPEMLAHKIYGDSEKHWVILAMNDMFNPLLDWPIEQRSLVDIIEKKYRDMAEPEQTGVEWAQQNYYAYYKIETQKNPLTDDVFTTTTQIDANTYADLITTSTQYTLDDGNVITVTVDGNAKTYYDYEIDTNEKKRIIKILNPQFLPIVDEEFRNVFK